MRELIFDDLFKLSEILDKMGIRADINKIFDEAKEKPDAQAYFGGQVVMMMIAKIHTAKKEVYDFLADLTGKKTDEIKRLKIGEVKDLFTELFSKNDISGFFNSAAVENE